MRRLTPIALWTLLAFAPQAASAADDAQKLADQAIRRLDLQTEFPRVPEPFKIPLKIPNGVLWAIIVVALAIVVYAFRDQIFLLTMGRRASWDADGLVLDESKSHSSEATLEAADQLAAHGRFVEAMHTLLLHGLATIRELSKGQLADSLTSREVLYSTNLPPEGRTSLHDMVTRVEWTYFGERPATRTDYDACRASFNIFAQSLHGKLAA